MNLMTKDDFPVERKGISGRWTERGRSGDGNGGWAHVPTEREPSTAIFLFFKMSPVIGGRAVEGRKVGRGKVGGGRGLKEGGRGL